MGIFVGKNAKPAALFAAFALGLYLGFRYVLPLAGPFLLAFLTVYMTYPKLERMQKKLHIRREILLGTFLAAAAAVIGAAFWALIRRSADWLPDLYQNLYDMETQLTRWLHGGCLFLEKNFGIDADEAEAVIVRQVEVFIEQLQVNVWPTAAKQSFFYLKKLGTAAAFLGIGFIAALLLCRDYEGLVSKCRSYPVLEMGWQFAEKTVQMVGGYVKAQGLILCAIVGIAMTGLWIGRIEGAFFWGALAGVLDALPFIGTGVVLVPLAVWQLLNGRFWSAAAAVICYVLCIAARELLEPRLLGRQLGVSPVIMLFSVYAGVKVFGLTGIFLGPLYVMLLREGCRMYRDRARAEEADASRRERR